MRAEGVKQKIRKAFLRGIIFERLRAAGPPYRCETCGRTADTLDDALDVTFAPSHIRPRSAGRGYQERDWPDAGVDDPGNVLVECWACNRGREPEPMWSQDGPG